MLSHESVRQGIVGGSTLVLLFFTFRHLPLGDATTIIFSSPVFVLIMSFLFLHEPCGFFRTMIVCLLLTGVVLISKPPFIFQVRHSAHVLLQLMKD
jgi:drug/metabolite transporter (DMT)-like permease